MKFRAGIGVATLAVALLQGSAMAVDRTHMERLKRTGSCATGCDLRRADLRRLHLAGANLANARLRRARLRWAVLTGATLKGADLRGADMRNANLRRVNLRSARLTAARLSGARFCGTIMPSGAVRNDHCGGRQFVRKDWRQRVIREKPRLPVGAGLIVPETSVSILRDPGGGPALLISGAIVNKATLPQRVSPMLITFLDREGRALRTITFRPASRVLAPGKSMAFRTRAQDPPENAVKLRFTFAKGRRR